MTSDLTSGEIPTRILLEAAEGVLLTDSLALWDNISAIRQICLEPSPYGAISPQSLLLAIVGWIDERKPNTELDKQLK